MHRNFYSKSKKFLRRFPAEGVFFLHYQYPFCHTLGQKLDFPPINTDSFKSAFFCFSVFVNKGVELIHWKQQIAVHKFNKISVNFPPTEKKFQIPEFFFSIFFNFWQKTVQKYTSVYHVQCISWHHFWRFSGFSFVFMGIK